MADTGLDSLAVPVTTTAQTLGAVLDAGQLTGLQSVQLTSDVDLLIGSPTRQVYPLVAGDVQRIDAAAAASLGFKSVSTTGTVYLLLSGV